MLFVVDLFCKQGGAAMGYRRAGIQCIAGFDCDAQPRYPFPFERRDWSEGLEHAIDVARSGHWRVLVHASPPCQRYMTGGSVRGREERPDLLGPVRDALISSGLDYVLENVPESPMRPTVVLCGSMFGLGVRRHRLFETSFALPPAPPCKHREQGPIVGVYGKPHGVRGAWPGMKPGSIASWSEAMGIDWMDADGLSQAIPPAYTEWIASHYLAGVK